MVKTGKTKVLYLMPFVVFCCVHWAVAQSKYIRTFNLKPVVSADVETLDDGGIIVVGEITPNGTMLQGGLGVMKYDACDQLLWSKSFWYEKAQIRQQDLSITNDGSILLSGYFNEEGSYYSYLIKVSKEGQLVFSNVYDVGPDQSEFVYSAAQMANGNYFMYGNRQEDPAGGFANMTIIVNPQGDVITAKEYFNIPIWGRTIATSDGGILARTGNVIYKLDEHADLLWARSIPVQGYYQSEPVEVAGGYIYACYATSNDQSKPAYLIKIDPNGSLLWVSDAVTGLNMLELVSLNNGDILVPSSMQIDSLSSSETFTVYHLFDGAGNLIDQYLEVPEVIENHRVLAVNAGTDDAIYVTSAVGDDIKLQVSRMFLNNNGLNACELQSVDARMEKPAIQLKEENVTPHALAVTRIPLNLNTSTIDPEYTERCYEKEVLTLNLGEDTALCLGQSLRIGSDREYPVYKWSTGATEQYIEVTEAGTYALMVGNGCETISDEVVISYYPVADTHYTVEPREVTPFQPVHFSGASNSSYHINWEFGAGQNSEASFDYTFPNNGVYPVVYSFFDEYGCFYSDTIDITVRYHSIYIPKAFTANDDGLNDSFKPVGYGIRSYQMDIYTRWGEHIYSEQNGGWNGRFKGELMPIDAYVYEITFIDEFGEETFRRGVFTLLR